MGKKPRRQHAKIESGGTDTRPSPQIRPRPDEVVGFSDDNLRGQVIKTEMAFQCRRYLDGVGPVERRGMCDGNHCHHVAPPNLLANRNDGTGAVFRSVLDALLLLSRLKIRVRNHQP